MSSGYDAVLTVSEKAVQNQLAVLFTTYASPNQPTPHVPNQKIPYLINHDIDLVEGPGGARLNGGLECPVIEIAPPLGGESESTRLSIKLKLGKRTDGFSSIYFPPQISGLVVDGYTITWQAEVADKDVWDLLEDAKGELRRRKQELLLASSGFLVSSLFRLCSLKAYADAFDVLDKDNRRLNDTDLSGFARFVSSYFESTPGPFLLGESLAQEPVHIDQADPGISSWRQMVDPRECTLFLNYTLKTIHIGMTARFTTSSFKPRTELKRDVINSNNVGPFQRSVTWPKKHDGVMLVSRGLFIELLYRPYLYKYHLNTTSATRSEFGNLQEYRDVVESDPVGSDCSVIKRGSSWNQEAPGNPGLVLIGSSRTTTTYLSDLSPGPNPWFTPNKADLGDRPHSHRMMIKQDMSLELSMKNSSGSETLRLEGSVKLEIKATSFGRFSYKVLEQPYLPSKGGRAPTYPVDGARSPTVFTISPGTNDGLKRQLEELAFCATTELNETICKDLDFLQTTNFFPGGATFMYSGVDTDSAGNLYSKLNYATLASGQRITNANGPSPSRLSDLRASTRRIFRVDRLDAKALGDFQLGLTKNILADIPVPSPSPLSPLPVSLLQNTFVLPAEPEVATTAEFGDQPMVSKLLSVLNNSLKAANEQISPWRGVTIDKLPGVLGSINPDATKRVKQILQQLHQELTVTVASGHYRVSGEQISRPLLESLRVLLEDRATAVNRCFTYDVVSLRRDLVNWYNNVNNVSAGCAAILMIHAKYRLLQAKYQGLAGSEYATLQQQVMKDIIAIDEQYNQQESTYAKILYGGVFAYPSTQLLLKEAAVDLSKRWPILYSLNLWDSAVYLAIFCAGDASRGSDQWDDGELVENRDAPTSGFTYRHAFAFAYTEFRTWTMRGSRFHAHPEGPATGTLRRNADDSKFGLREQSPLEFKIIPHPSNPGSDPRATLQSLTVNRSGVGRRQWNVWIQSSRNLQSTLTFNLPLDQQTNALNAKLGSLKRILLWINNNAEANVIFILYAVRVRTGANTFCATNGSVWLKGQRACIGIGNRERDIDDIQTVIQLKSYFLRPEWNAADQNIVASLLYQDPTTGRLTVPDDKGRFVGDVFIKVWNPLGIRYNYLSVMTICPSYFTLGPTWTDMDQIDLQRFLDTYAVSQNTQGLNDKLAGFIFNYQISGSDYPDGSVDIITRKEGWFW